MRLFRNTLCLDNPWTVRSLKNICDFYLFLLNEKRSGNDHWRFPIRGQFQRKLHNTNEHTHTQNFDCIFLNRTDTYYLWHNRFCLVGFPNGQANTLAYVTAVCGRDRLVWTHRSDITLQNVITDRCLNRASCSIVYLLLLRFNHLFFHLTTRNG